MQGWSKAVGSSRRVVDARDVTSPGMVGDGQVEGRFVMAVVELQKSSGIEAALGTLPGRATIGP